jgi:hypothetical protein
MNMCGWVVSAAASVRYAAEGNVPGTAVSGFSYYFGVDKKTHNGDMLSVVLFGASSRNERASPVLEECLALTGSAQYNSNWGLQAGRKRNANTARTHIPAGIFTYDHRIDNHQSLLLSAGIMTGQKSTTALDWYNAADPRPDYYRYLPSYQKDSVLRGKLVDMYQADPLLLQVNWDRLYTVNRNSFEITHDVDGVPRNSFGGLRAHYVIERRVTAVQRLALNCIYNSQPLKEGDFAGGFSVQWQRNHFYKKLEDLLGGEYYVDWNQFAEGDASVVQNDLDHSNRLVRTGDRYGYNYVSLTTAASGWAQVTITKKRIDVFAAVQLGYTNFLRDGLARTGLFPDHSLGRSALHEFSEYTGKAGITYKINGRKYLYLHAAMLSRAPLFTDVFISPATRDTEQEQVSTEKILSAEAGYILNAPSIKFRLSGYATQFSGGMNVLTFYHDGYRSFVNYALSGISHMHAGLEAGLELKISPVITMNAVVATGIYYYNRRPAVAVSIDNDDYITERGEVYIKNFRVSGTPQQAYSLGLAYQSPKYFYMNLSGSYFRQQWLEFNPLRRTEAVQQSVLPGSDQWNRTIGQTILPDQYSIDLALGNSFRVKLGAKKRILLLYAGVSNLLNQALITGGYEQLRFDTGDPEKFPPKFFYAPGLQFSVNLTLRL